MREKFAALNRTYTLREHTNSSYLSRGFDRDRVRRRQLVVAVADSRIVAVDSRDLASVVHKSSAAKMMFIV